MPIPEQLTEHVFACRLWHSQLVPTVLRNNMSRPSHPNSPEPIRYSLLLEVVFSHGYVSVQAGC
jgi:hypothetical protein